MPATAGFDEGQRQTLNALCETYAPSVEVGGDDPIEREFMRCSALDLGVSVQIEGTPGCTGGGATTSTPSSPA